VKVDGVTDEDSSTDPSPKSPIAVPPPEYTPPIENKSGFGMAQIILLLAVGAGIYLYLDAQKGDGGVFGDILPYAQDEEPVNVADDVSLAP
jgi:hypothetical protein